MSQHSASSDPGGAAGADYVPVACAFHDTLEHAAVLRLMCRITYHAPGDVERTVTTTIDDVWSEGGEEFARLGNGASVRLDRLGQVEALPRPDPTERSDPA